MIRKALKRDCLDLAALSLQVWLHTYAVKGVRSQISKYALSTFNEEYFAKLLKRECIDVRVFEEDSHLIGFIVADLNSELEDVSGYEIVTLYVSQHFHGKGVGRQLLREIESAHGLPFWLSTWVNNHDAIGFYDKLGFNIVGELNFNLEGELHRNHVFAYAGT
ncbi:GNAT family N-acetyltransferase [Halomonas sp. KG2]|uniref:GNAT family N-acetyltransferase n=1 Tax=Halomonas sp. KG2 TaxID=2951138 RepID=UPI0026471F94|nr:GNAT family N-acetyltransferase [Halomonas sp. KG2]WKD30040.1 GNAT family N-acetyltransferase [Halomonas sp. KG2]